jgi:hypothetical protein
MLNAYDVLGLAAGADRDEVRAAYVDLAKQLHPDRNAGSEQAKQRFQEVNQAYELLKDPRRRAAYDRLLGLAHTQLRRRRRYAAGVMAASFALTTIVTSVLLFVAPFLLRGGTPAASGNDNPVRSAQQPSFASNAPATGAVGARREAAPATTGDIDMEELNRDAVVALPALLWARLAAGSDPLALLDFIERFSEVAEAAQARAKLARLIESTTDQSTLRSILDHPGAGAFADQVKQRLAILQARAPIASAPPDAVPPHAWITYRNDRFGFALDYPADEFIADDRGLGEFWRLFVSRDGRARLLITAGFNAKGVTAASYRQSLMNEAFGGANLEYAPLRKTWFVLAGSRGEEMFYERATFACDGRIIHGWRLTYPAGARDYYSQIIERMHRGYKHVRGAGAHCG